MFAVLILLASPVLSVETAVARAGSTQRSHYKYDQLLIAGFPDIYVYSLKDFRLIIRFGKKGEGPQEFLNYVKLQSYPENIVISSKKKVSFFDKNGDFIKEIRSKSPTATVDEFKPLADIFVVYGEVKEGNTLFYTMDLSDAALQKTKEITRWESVHQSGKGS